MSIFSPPGFRSGRNMVGGRQEVGCSRFSPFMCSKLKIVIILANKCKKGIWDVIDD